MAAHGGLRMEDPISKQSYHVLNLALRRTHPAVPGLSKESYRRMGRILHSLQDDNSQYKCCWAVYSLW